MTTLPRRPEGTTPNAPRGMLLRDTKGMWWRLDCSADLKPYLTGTVQISGIVTAEGRIEVCHVADKAA